MAKAKTHQTKVTRVKYIECPECESNFRVSADGPLTLPEIS